MIKTDDLYLENLSELVYDEKKVVTYKFLSVFLGVHVNLAKQMLYTFLEREKKLGKKLYAMLYVSGLVKESTDSQSQGRRSRDSTDTVAEKHVILLCKEADLESVKEKFSSIYSVHVYCVSSLPIEDYASLQPVISKSVKDAEGKTPSDYGPFKCSAERKSSAAKTVAETKAPAVTTTKSTKEPPQEKAKEPEPEAVKKPAAKTPTNSKGKNFFGTQTQSSKSGSSKPSNQSSIMASMGKMKASVKKETPTPAPKPQVKEVNGNSKSNKEQKKESKNPSKNRKRIRMASESDSDFEDSQNKKRPSVFTSSEDDASEDEDSPRSRRKNPIQISSESEDEAPPPVPKSPPKKETVPAEPASGTGRKRVAKTIDKTFMDDEGYLVTKKETVFVSEDDDDMEMQTDSKEEKTSVQKDVSTKPAATVQPSSNPNKTKEGKQNGTASTASGTSSKASSQTKSKQASIMSFFQKK